MTKKLHTEDGADSAAEATIYKEMFFWNSSFLSLRFSFIYPSDDEGEEIDQE